MSEEGDHIEYLLDELSELSEHVRWATARCNAAMGEGFQGTCTSSVAAVCDTVVIQRDLIEHWRTALRQISNAESGTWGRIARAALDREVIS